MEDKVRYSDEELEEFKQIILERLEKSKKIYEELKESVTNGDGELSSTAPTFKVLEEGATTLSKELNGLLAQKEMVYIKCLEAALVRIGNKTYGICRKTGKLIPKERLRIVPHATLTVEAKMEENK